MTNEIYKEIPGWEGLYLISNFGNVLSLKNNLKLKPIVNNMGYGRIQLFKNGYKTRHYIHRLVAENFVDGYFEGAVVNHKDFNKMNNRADNLEWVSPSENSKHAYDNGHNPGSFKTKAYMLITEDGDLLGKFDTLRESCPFIGIGHTKLYQLVANGGYIPKLNAFLIPCDSND